MCLVDEFCIAHILREANQAANSFAKYGLNLDSCSRMLYYFPRFTLFVARADREWVLFPEGF